MKIKELKLKDIINNTMEKIIMQEALAKKSILVDYHKIHHIMRNKFEVQVPNKIETYTFYKKEGWRIVNNTDDIITLIKET